MVETRTMMIIIMMMMVNLIMIMMMNYSKYKMIDEKKLTQNINI